MGAPQTVIRAGSLFDGAGAPPIADAAVVVEGSRIVAAGPEEAIEAPRGPDVAELDFPGG